MKIALHPQRSEIEGNVSVERKPFAARRRFIGKICRDRVSREQLRKLRHERSDIVAVRNVLRGKRVFRIGEHCRDLHAEGGKFRRDIAQRDRTVVGDPEREAHGKVEPEQRERGRERRALSVARLFKDPAAELFQKRIGVKTAAVASGQTRKRVGIEPDLVFAEDQTDAVSRIFKIHVAQLCAQGERAKVGRIHIDKSGDGTAVQRKIDGERDGLRQNRRERLGKTVRRSQRVPLRRTRCGFVGIIFEIGLVRVGIRPVRAVLIIGRVGRRTFGIEPLGCGVGFVDIGTQDLPRGIKGVGHRDVFKRGKGGQSAREHHLIDVIGGRLVGSRVKVIGLRIRSVAVVRHLGSALKGLFVDDIHGEFRSGKSARFFIVLNRHIAERRAVLPCGVHTVVGGGAARGFAPDDAVAHPAELLRRIDQAGSRDVRLDEHAVRILLPGVHLLAEHGIDAAVHFRVPDVLRPEACIHVADVFKRGMHIGRGAVGGKLIEHGGKTVVHRVGSRLIEKQRVDAESTAHQNAAGRCRRQYFFQVTVMFCL